MLNIVAILLVLTATFSYVNQRFLRWPTTIGVMAIALAVSLAVVGLDELGFAMPGGEEHRLLASIDFADVLMQGMLSFLLFAGALHVEINQLRRVAWQVAALAVLGTALSMLIIGYGSWFLLSALGIAIPLLYCLLFGALISPTDPIAVLSVLKSARVSPTVEATIAGEARLRPLLLCLRQAFLELADLTAFALRRFLRGKSLGLNPRLGRFPRYTADSPLTLYFDPLGPCTPTH